MVESFIEKLTDIYRNGLHEQEQTEENIAALNYGITVIFLNLPKTAALLFIAKKLKILRLVLWTLGFYGLIRNFSLGIHAKTSIRCFLMGITNYLGIAYISRTVTIPRRLYNIIYACCFCIYLLYAPSATAINPLNKVQHRQFKLMSLFIVSSYYFIGRISSRLIRNVAALAVIFQSFSINPLTYKLSKQKRGVINEE